MGIKDRLAEYRWAVAQNIGDFRDSRVAAAIKIGLIMTVPISIAGYLAYITPEGNPRPTPTAPPPPGEFFVDPALAAEQSLPPLGPSFIPPDQCAIIPPGGTVFSTVKYDIDPKTDLFDMSTLPRPAEQIRVMVFNPDGTIDYQEGPLTGANSVDPYDEACVTGVNP